MQLFASPENSYHGGSGGHCTHQNMDNNGFLTTYPPYLVHVFLNDPPVICDEKDQAAVTEQLKGNHNTYLFIQRKKKTFVNPRMG